MTKTANSTKANKSTPKAGAKHQVISDYNGYDYKKIFWEDADRKYEDMADRLAIRRLLPKTMDNFVDIAGGYGRLAKEYLNRSKSATLFDYSQTELDQAKEEFKGKLKTQQGDIYHLPFKDNTFDALMMVRATHHFKDMPAVTRELYRILQPGGVAVIEVANKHTLPKMVRYWSHFGKTEVNPFSKQPSNLKSIDADGFYNYHPKYIEKVFKDAGFEIVEVLSVSNFRNKTMKKLFKTKTLVKMEKKMQKPLAKIHFAPSIYYKLIKTA